LVNQKHLNPRSLFLFASRMMKGAFISISWPEPLTLSFPIPAENAWRHVLRWGNRRSGYSKGLLDSLQETVKKSLIAKSLDRSDQLARVQSRSHKRIDRTTRIVGNHERIDWQTNGRPDTW
jgi:hypothetical protein